MSMLVGVVGLGPLQIGMGAFHAAMGTKDKVNHLVIKECGNVVHMTTCSTLTRIQILYHERWQGNLVLSLRGGAAAGGRTASEALVRVRHP